MHLHTYIRLANPLDHSHSTRLVNQHLEGVSSKISLAFEKRSTKHCQTGYAPPHTRSLRPSGGPLNRWLACHPPYPDPVQTLHGRTSGGSRAHALGILGRDYDRQLPHGGASVSRVYCEVRCRLHGAKADPRGISRGLAASRAILRRLDFARTVLVAVFLQMSEMLDRCHDPERRNGHNRKHYGDVQTSQSNRCADRSGYP